MKFIPDKDLLLFRSCLVSVEYPGVEASTKFVFDKLDIDYKISYIFSTRKLFINNNKTVIYSPDNIHLKKMNLDDRLAEDIFLRTSKATNGA